ncbi:hypothetical protein B0H21DRAFT_687817 [Amylocystis lapponica]|nr:hypothetical protein B0H21DRAFT_687817 [Amylocystis lapponica]
MPTRHYCVCEVELLAYSRTVRLYNIVRPHSSHAALTLYERCRLCAAHLSSRHFLLLQHLTHSHSASYQLYDLRVEVICPPDQRIMCGAKEGDYFTLEGETLRLPPGQGISIYSLGSVLPLLAAKQRVTSPNDWMSTDAEIACPDPHCKSRLRIVRTSVRTFRHGDVTVVPLPARTSDVEKTYTERSPALPQTDASNLPERDDAAV